MPLYSLGLDFGTESVRALAVDVHTGHVAGESSVDYAHGVIEAELPTGGGRLPADYALQHPQDWIDGYTAVTRQAIRAAAIDPSQIIGVGVDFTSCTMLPCRRDGTPLCLMPKHARTPLAWPKLWKHHAAKAETDRINEVARERREPWLDRYGGAIGLEWFFPKIFETLRQAPEVYADAEVWLEAGDWLVWQLTGGPFPTCSADRLVRSTCQAGYKAMWNAEAGYPSADYFAAVDPKLANVVTEKMPGILLSPGRRAGGLSPAAAKLAGLPAGIAVSAAIIDAHAGVPGAGVADDGALVMVLGTSGCHMLNSRIERLVPGVAGVVRDGILPGFFGYETGQASVGDAFAWVAQTLGRSHEELTQAAAPLPPGAGGVLAIDWFNGCRTPLMDGRLSGAFIGLTLQTKPEQLYRATLEATAFGLRRIVETLRGGGVPVNRFVASGGLPSRSPLLMQIYADVLNEPIHVPAVGQSVALGAAILGCLAAGQAVTRHADGAAAIAAMARSADASVHHPDRRSAERYEAIHQLYRSLTDGDGPLARSMRDLRVLR